MAASKKKKPAAKKSNVKKAAPKNAAAKKSAAPKTKAKPAAKKSAAKTVAKTVAKIASKVFSAKPEAKSQKSAAPAKARTSTEAFTPLDDRVLIEPAGVSEKTAGGLFIPSMAQERPLQGKVLAVGKGARNKKGMLRPLDVQVGDEVLYAKYTGTNIEVGGREVVLLKESEILGIVPDFSNFVRNVIDPQGVAHGSCPRLSALCRVGAPLAT